jgi:hypothetical protein
MGPIVFVVGRLGCWAVAGPKRGLLLPNADRGALERVSRRCPAVSCPVMPPDKAATGQVSWEYKNIQWPIPFPTRLFATSALHLETEAPARAAIRVIPAHAKYHRSIRNTDVDAPQHTI